MPEGEYTFKLIKGKETLEGKVELVADPRNPHPKEDRLLQQTTALEAYDLLGDLTFLADSVTDLRDQAKMGPEIRGLGRCGKGHGHGFGMSPRPAFGGGSFPPKGFCRLPRQQGACQRGELRR